MGRDWIDEGLRQTPARERQRQLASERRRREAATIATRAPELMRQLIAELGAALDEYRQKATTGRGDEIEFELLPHEGFSITKPSFPKMYLECRPDYAGQILWCNLSRTDNDESDDIRVRELAFTLHFTVSDSDVVALRREPRIFKSASEAAEFFLEPVLFPQPDHLL
jgi:hypothetical protein